MKTLLKLTALAVLIPSAVIFAAEPGEAKPKMSPFQKADANKDGKVTKEEYLATRKDASKHENDTKRFDRADADKDGALNEEEFKALIPKPKKKEGEAK